MSKKRTEKQAPGRGGARAGAGRPARDGAAGMIRKNVSLDQSSIDKLRAFGGGDLSLGIRHAAACITVTGVTLDEAAEAFRPRLKPAP